LIKRAAGNVETKRHEEIDVEPIDFGQVGQRVVDGRFGGGNMTSDGALMLLGVLAVLWTPAVLFWAALALAPTALLAIIAITRGWWM
jgi:hypothetical protein